MRVTEVRPGLHGCRRVPPSLPPARSFRHTGRSSHSFTDEDTETQEGGPIAQERGTQLTFPPRPPAPTRCGRKPQPHWGQPGPGTLTPKGQRVSTAQTRMISLMGVKGPCREVKPSWVPSASPLPLPRAEPQKGFGFPVGPAPAEPLSPGLGAVNTQCQSQERGLQPPWRSCPAGHPAAVAGTTRVVSLDLAWPSSSLGVGQQPRHSLVSESRGCLSGSKPPEPEGMPFSPLIRGWVTPDDGRVVVNSLG